MATKKTTKTATKKAGPAKKAAPAKKKALKKAILKPVIPTS
jgi:hypothetical protein